MRRDRGMADFSRVQATLMHPLTNSGTWRRGRGLGMHVPPKMCWAATRCEWRARTREILLRGQNSDFTCRLVARSTGMTCGLLSDALTAAMSISDTLVGGRSSPRLALWFGAPRRTALIVRRVPGLVGMAWIFHPGHSLAHPQTGEVRRVRRRRTDSPRPGILA